MIRVFFLAGMVATYENFLIEVHEFQGRNLYEMGMYLHLLEL